EHGEGAGLPPEAKVNEMLLTGSDEPDYFVDIGDYVEQKVDAMLCHASQISSRNRDEMIKNMRERGNRRGGPGGPGGRGLVESFKRVRIVRQPQAAQEATPETAAASA